MVGFRNNHGVFLLKMMILGCFGGTTIFGNPHIFAAWPTWRGVERLDGCFYGCDFRDF